MLADHNSRLKAKYFDKLFSSFLLDSKMPDGTVFSLPRAEIVGSGYLCQSIKPFFFNFPETKAAENLKINQNQ